MSLFRPEPQSAEKPAAKPQNRSNEEMEMRALIVPELRKRYPTARIVHELPLRYSTNRIDLAAITETQIISVEIKSSRDVADRLEKQLREFIPISARVIVALAPKWNEKLPAKTEEGKLRGGQSYTAYIPQLTECQQIIHRVGNGPLEVWTVDAAAQTIDITERCYRDQRPWLSRMLHVLHVTELAEIGAQHRCFNSKRPVHEDIVAACTEQMTGREIVTSVCAALRARDAFGADSDPPIVTQASKPSCSSALDRDRGAGTLFAEVME